ncbi:hypothetical protein DFH09DRAFT_1322203 [Mycena vulgaris]|nr:hypothetical protein DFH09DRAFT_1322203 [Mycena vulgaris]
MADFTAPQAGPGSVILPPADNGNGHPTVAAPKAATPSKTFAVIDVVTPSQLPAYTVSRDVMLASPSPRKGPTPLPKTSPAPVLAMLPKPPVPAPGPCVRAQCQDVACDGYWHFTHAIPISLASPPLLDPVSIVPPPSIAVDSGMQEAWSEAGYALPAEEILAGVATSHIAGD